MEQENVGIYTNDRILLSLQKGNLAIYHNTDEPGEHYTQ
jgi:hypothetical protein